MADNFNMKKFLAENKLGPYAKAKTNEEIGGDIGDAEAEKMMDFLAEDGDETWFSDMNYFKKEHEGYKLKPTDMVSIGDIPAMTYAQALKKFIKKEGYMGTQYDSSEDMAADMIKKGITREGRQLKEYNKNSGPQMEELLKILKDLQEKNKEIKAVGTKTLEKMIYDLETEIRRLPNMDGNVSQYNTNEGIEDAINEAVDNRTLMKVEKLQDILSNLKSNTSTNSNIPTRDKQGLLAAFSYIEEILEDVGADIEMEMDDTYVPNSGGLNEALEPHVYERMYNLSNIKAQQAMIRAAEIMMRELTEEGFEVEEVREFFTQLIVNDI
jgi:hypothetical protein